MENLIKNINKIIQEEKKNSTIKFIIKRNVEQCSIKAYKKITLELFLHIPKKNIKCITVSNTFNCSGFSEKEIISKTEPYFYFIVLKWILSDDFKNKINELHLE